MFPLNTKSLVEIEPMAKAIDGKFDGFKQQIIIENNRHFESIKSEVSSTMMSSNKPLVERSFPQTSLCVLPHHKDSKIPHIVKRWLVENKRVVIISSFVSIGFVLLLLVVVLSGRAGSAPLSGGRVSIKKLRAEENYFGIL